MMREMNMTNARSTAPGLLWATVLGGTAIVGSYGLACVFPFAAIAALAAVTLDARRAALLVGAVWAANQIVGFTLMSYPHDAQAYAWGAIILFGALSALGAARLVVGRNVHLLSMRTLGGLAAAIVAYQAVMFVGAFMLDGFESSTPAIVAQIALNDSAWFAGLAAVRLLLTRTVPKIFAPAAV
jgi:hypothetical protein